MGGDADAQPRQDRTASTALRGYLRSASVLTAVLLIADLGAKAVHVYLVEVHPALRLLDVNRESNIPTWWNAALLLAVAASAWVIALLGEEGRRGWALVGLVATLMSLDESARLHERIAGPAASWARSLEIDLTSYAWLLLGAPLAVVGAAVAITWSRRLPGPVRRGLRLGVLLYGLGAVGAEALSGWIDAQVGVGWLYWLTTTVEEGLEMLACVVAVAALLRLVVVRGTDVGSGVVLRLK